MDTTEDIRRQMIQEINTNPTNRADLEARYGRIWSTSELTQDFEIISFLSPFVFVNNKITGKQGSLCFQDLPRFYFDFMEY